MRKMPSGISRMPRGVGGGAAAALDATGTTAAGAVLCAAASPANALADGAALLGWASRCPHAIAKRRTPASLIP